MLTVHQCCRFLQTTSRSFFHFHIHHTVIVTRSDIQYTCVFLPLFIPLPQLPEHCLPEKKLACQFVGRFGQRKPLTSLPFKGLIAPVTCFWWTVQLRSCSSIRLWYFPLFFLLFGVPGSSHASLGSCTAWGLPPPGGWGILDGKHHPPRQGVLQSRHNLPGL